MPWQYNMAGCQNSSIILLQPMFIYENLIQLIIQHVIPSPPRFSGDSINGHAHIK